MRKLLLLSALFVAPLLGMSSADAGPLSVQVVAGGITQTFGPTSTGILNFLAAPIDGFAIVSGTATSAPLGNNPTLIDLSSLQVAAAAGGTVRISITETGLTSLGDGFFSAIGGTLGVASTLTFQTFIDSTNTAFGTQQLLGTNTFSNTIPFSNSFTSNGLPGTGLFSETEVFTIVAGANSTTSFDGRLNQNIPEPASMALLGVGLAAIGVTRRRSRKAA